MHDTLGLEADCTCAVQRTWGWQNSESEMSDLMCEKGPDACSRMVRWVLGRAELEAHAARTTFEVRLKHVVSVSYPSQAASELASVPQPHPQLVT